MNAGPTIPAVMPAAPRPGSSPAEGACDAAAFLALLAGLVPAPALSPLPASPAAAETIAPVTVAGAEGCARRSADGGTGATVASVIGGTADQSIAGSARKVTPGGTETRPSTPRNPVQVGRVGAAVPSAPGERSAAPPAPLALATPTAARPPVTSMSAPPGWSGPVAVAGQVPQTPTTPRRAPAADPSAAPAISPERIGVAPAVGTPADPTEAVATHPRPAPGANAGEAPVLAPAERYPHALPVTEGAVPPPTATPAAPATPSAAAVDHPEAVGTVVSVGMRAAPTPDAMSAPSRARTTPPADPDPRPAADAPSRPADPMPSAAHLPTGPSAADQRARAPRMDVAGEPRAAAVAPRAVPTDRPEHISLGGPAPEPPVAAVAAVEEASDAPGEPQADLASDAGEPGAGQDAVEPTAPHRVATAPPLAESAAAAGAVPGRSGAPEPTMQAPPAQHAPAVRVHLPELPARTEAAGVHHVRLEVDPPELGRCELELTLREGTVRAVVVAERADTVVVLREIEGQVRAALADRHLQMTDFDVRHGGGGGDAGGAPRQDTGARPPSVTPRLGPSPEPSAPPPSPRSPGPARRVDLIA